MLILLIIIGSIFSLAAALIAGLTTGYEYVRGQKPDKRLAFWAALKTGLVTLLIFAALTAVIGLVLNRTL
jgi:hypothetical protein